MNAQFMEKLTEEISFLRKLMETTKTLYLSALAVDIASVKHAEHLFSNLKQQEQK